MFNSLLAIYWNPSPDAFTIGVFAIKWYGLLWALSLMLVYFIQGYVYRSLGKPGDEISLAILYVFIGGLVGARLGHVLFYQFDYYLTYPLKIFYVREGGLASHGGLAGGIIGLYLYCRGNKVFPFLWVVDMGAIAVPVLAGLIRLGNLINSELPGTPTNVPWAFVFGEDHVPRHPVVLYESMAYLFLQGIMFYLFGRYKDTRPGIYLATLLVYLFGLRFLLEFFKLPDGLVIAGISKTQLLNLPYVLVGLVLLYYSLKEKLKYH